MVWPGSATSKHVVCFKPNSLLDKFNYLSMFYSIFFYFNQKIGNNCLVKHTILEKPFCRFYKFQSLIYKECFKYKVQKITFGNGPFLPQKYKILQKPYKKKLRCYVTLRECRKNTIFRSYFAYMAKLSFSV